jgi:hypothetical protein
LDEFDSVDATAGSIDETAGIEWELLGIIEVQNDRMRQYDTTIWVLRADAENDHG